MCNLFDGKHPGLIKLLVPEKDRCNSADVAAGSHYYEQVQKQAFTMLVHLRVAVVKPYKNCMKKKMEVASPFHLHTVINDQIGQKDHSYVRPVKR